MRKEGLARLYHGAQPLFVQRGTLIGIMYSLYNTFHNTLPDWSVRLLAGETAGTVDALALMPLKRVQTLLQLRETPYRGTLQIGMTLAQHGPGELYHGPPSAIVENEK